MTGLLAMKIREFLRTANVNQLCDFIYVIISGCECCGDCPFEKLSEMVFDSEPYYDCNHDCIMNFLDSEMKKEWNK